uniref:SERTA domain-containing protein n=1 Tax=Parascaris univalens TaxID=6257 RepID=A0A914ZHC0_PARUN
MEYCFPFSKVVRQTLSVRCRYFIESPSTLLILCSSLSPAIVSLSCLWMIAAMRYLDSRGDSCYECFLPFYRASISYQGIPMCVLTVTILSSYLSSFTLGSAPWTQWCQGPARSATEGETKAHGCEESLETVD